MVTVRCWIFYPGISVASSELSTDRFPLKSHSDQTYFPRSVLTTVGAYLVPAPRSQGDRGALRCAVQPFRRRFHPVGSLRGHVRPCRCSGRWTVGAAPTRQDYPYLSGTAATMPCWLGPRPRREHRHGGAEGPSEALAARGRDLCYGPT